MGRELRRVRLFRVAAALEGAALELQQQAVWWRSLVQLTIAVIVLLRHDIFFLRAVRRSVV